MGGEESSRSHPCNIRYKKRAGNVPSLPGQLRTVNNFSVSLSSRCWWSAILLLYIPAQLASNVWYYEQLVLLLGCLPPTCSPTLAQSVGDCHQGWKDVNVTRRHKMTALQEWLQLYLEPRRSRGHTDTPSPSPWRDGHLYTEALNRIFPDWFSKIR